MLTGRAEEVDRIVGLTVGADDYVTKPFSPREVLARVDALLRRPRVGAAAGAAPAAAEPAATGRRFGPVAVHPEARECTVEDVPVELTRTEFEILDALTENPRTVLTREQLRERVWGGGWFGDDHAVDVHVSNLRRKLSRHGAPEVVATVRGVGYRLAPALLRPTTG
jgi:DNA-binding response OmpR family regulator